MSLLYLSEGESIISGLRIARGGRINEIKPELLLTEIVKGGFDLCRIKVNAKSDNLFPLLDKLGIPWHIHSILVRNSMEIKPEEVDIPGYFSFELFDGSKRQLMKSVIEECLSQGTSTFYCNEYQSALINNKVELEIATSFLLDFVPQSHTGRLSWIIYYEGNPAAFLAGIVFDNNFEGVYYGVVPEFRGKNQFARMIMRFIKQYCIKNGVQYFSNDVPLQNLSSLKSIIKESVLPVETYLHVIVYPLIHYTQCNTTHRVELSNLSLKRLSEAIFDFKPYSSISGALKNSRFCILDGEAENLPAYLTSSQLKLTNGNVSIISQVTDKNNVLLALAYFTFAG